MNCWSRSGFRLAPTVPGKYIPKTAAGRLPGDSDGLFLNNHNKAIRFHWPLRSMFRVTRPESALPQQMGGSTAVFAALTGG